MQEQSHSFGYWLRRRRKALDLTQGALGQKVSCSGFTIRKIEADERRPSRRLAERLAAALTIPEQERRAFLDVARGVQATGRLALDAAPLGAVAEEAATGPAHASTLDAASESAPFVGRGNEYGLLIGLVARLTTGSGHAILIEGEPGIGKSRLMSEIMRYAEAQGMPTLATNCYEIERAIPYQPVIDLVTRALERASSKALRKLAPVSLAELAALVPAVRERFPQLPRLSDDFPEARQARLSRAVGQLLEALQEDRPLILTVDDVQWADDASAQVLHYLARHVADRRALVIYAYRDEDLGSNGQLARLVQSLRRETHVRRIALARLRPEDAQTLVTALGDARFGAPGLAERLYRETDGNPFFLMSILQSLGDGEIQLEARSRDGAGMLPDALRAAVRARITHVPQDIPADPRIRGGSRPALRLRHFARRDARAGGAAARCGRGAREAPLAARGAGGRCIRFQPRQAARGGLPRHRRGSAQAAASLGGGSPGTARRRRDARARCPAGGALRAGTRLVEGARVPGARRRALAGPVRDARCVALARPRGRALPSRTGSR